jgi:hypothetical protein
MPSYFATKCRVAALTRVCGFRNILREFNLDLIGPLLTGQVATTGTVW